MILAAPACTHVVCGGCSLPCQRRIPWQSPLMKTFQDDDAGYRSWLYANMQGYVVNALRGSNPGEPVLHRAACDTITPTPDKSWPAEYIKICFDHRFELESSARTHGRRLTSCEFCAP